MSPVSPGGQTSTFFWGFMFWIQIKHIYIYIINKSIHIIYMCMHIYIYISIMYLPSKLNHQLISLGNHQNESKRYSHLGVVKISPLPGRVATIRWLSLSKRVYVIRKYGKCGFRGTQNMFHQSGKMKTKRDSQTTKKYHNLGRRRLMSS